MVRRDVERFSSYFVGACAYSGGIVLLMELRHLRYFVAVAEEQNVSRAAKRLHVSQPPLSRQIRDLETEMGVALFERSVKAIRLTEAGKIFLFEARAALQLRALRSGDRETQAIEERLTVFESGSDRKCFLSTFVTNRPCPR
jgi:DNA-binding transcriptional LysR family regulator